MKDKIYSLYEKYKSSSDKSVFLPISLKTANNAYSVIGFFNMHGVAVVKAVPSPLGEINLEWRGKDWSAGVAVSEKHISFEYADLTGKTMLSVEPFNSIGLFVTLGKLIEILKTKNWVYEKNEKY